MKTKPIKIHAVSLFLWLLGIIVYLYTQNNLYSCVFVTVILAWLSKNYIQFFWKDLLYSWLILSLGLVLFYGLFLHEGDYPLFLIPGDIPLISGVVSLNSILYGFFMGGSFTLALFVFSLFSVFLSQQRPGFYLPGIFSNLSFLFSFLSHYVSFFLHHRGEFQEKIENRGLKVSWKMKARLFLHDSSFHSLENAFSFSESLEMRGFSSLEKNQFSNLDYILMAISVSFLFSIFLYRIYHQMFFLGLMVLLFSVLIFIMFKIKKSSTLANTYNFSLDQKDWVLVVWSCLFIITCLLLSFQSKSYLSRQNIVEYFIFDWKTHLMFGVHFLIAISFFEERTKKI